MQYLVLIFLCIQLRTNGDDANLRVQLDEVVQRHRDYVVSHLKDDDAWTATMALCALATLDSDCYIDRLREKLRLPITDPALMQVLGCLIKQAKPEDIKRIKEIVREAAKKGEEDRKKDPFVADAAITEFSSLEVLLASGDPKAVQFATIYLKDVIRCNPGPGITQMSLALDLVGRYKVKSAIAEIQLEKINPELQDVALGVLAKNGEEHAIDALKQRMEIMKDLWFIISDSQLVEKLGLTLDQLRQIYRNGDNKIRIAAAGQLARKGYIEELHEITRETLANNANVELIELLEQEIGKNGDETFVSELDKFASKSSTTTRKLDLSKEIFRVMRRSKYLHRKECPCPSQKSHPHEKGEAGQGQTQDEEEN